MHRSNGYESHAMQFMRHRDNSTIGVSTVLNWSKSLSPNSSILDLGCGSGKPIAINLDAHGFMMYGIDTSDTLIAAYRQHLPRAEACCEPIETSTFFNRNFNAAIAIGLIFLLPEKAQIALIHRLANALTTDGRLLFTSPSQVHQWRDILTGVTSLSLGREAYLSIATEAGFVLENEWEDEGSNHYYALLRRATISLNEA